LYLCQGDLFRQGGLALRVGMDEVQFAEVTSEVTTVVYQTAAQLALSSMGYKLTFAGA
jgi:hypothetical protein